MSSRLEITENFRRPQNSQQHWELRDYAVLLPDNSLVRVCVRKKLTLGIWCQTQPQSHFLRVVCQMNANHWELRDTPPFMVSLAGISEISTTHLLFYFLTGRAPNYSQNILRPADRYTRLHVFNPGLGPGYTGPA